MTLGGHSGRQVTQHATGQLPVEETSSSQWLVQRLVAPCPHAAALCWVKANSPAPAPSTLPPCAGGAARIAGKIAQCSQHPQPGLVPLQFLARIFDLAPPTHHASPLRQINRPKFSGYELLNISQLSHPPPSLLESARTQSASIKDTPLEAKNHSGQHVCRFESMCLFFFWSSPSPQDLRRACRGGPQIW